jgi:hypothetical protein
METLDLDKPLPGHASLDSLIAEYATYKPRYVEASGARWFVFFAHLFPEAASGGEDNDTIPIKGSAN